ncbi:hypothetical protein [Tessaracoccus sp.]
MPTKDGHLMRSRAVTEYLSINPGAVNDDYRFAAMDWTDQDWDDLLTRWGGLPAGVQTKVRDWLLKPRKEPLPQPLTPAGLGSVLSAETWTTSLVLDALGNGVPPVFIAAITARLSAGGGRAHTLDFHPNIEWRNALDLGLAEDQAVTWAYTTLLESSPHRSLSERSPLLAWTDQFGPTAYLWAAAGYTLNEALTMRDSGTTVTNDQLRVAVALKGITLPAGI